MAMSSSTSTMSSCSLKVITPFTKLMLEIKGSLSKENFSEMKFACSDHVRQGTMEEVDDFLSLVLKLENRNIINRKKPDLYFLIDLLETFDRYDIAKKVRDFQAEHKQKGVPEVDTLGHHMGFGSMSKKGSNPVPDNLQQQLLAGLNVDLHYPASEEMNETDEETFRKVTTTNNVIEPETIGVQNRRVTSDIDVENNNEFVPFSNYASTRKKVSMTDLECDVGPEHVGLAEAKILLDKPMPRVAARSEGDSSSCKLSSVCGLPSSAPTINEVSPSMEYISASGPCEPTPQKVDSHPYTTGSSTVSTYNASTLSHIDEEFEGIGGFRLKGGDPPPVNLQLRGPEDKGVDNEDGYTTAYSSVRPELQSTSYDHKQMPETRKAKIELWNYQKELATAGLQGKNAIICAPTGSGKTFTAAHICQHRWLNVKEKSSYKALFIVCIRNLIEQQCQALKQIFTEGITVCEIKQTDKLKDVLKKHNVVVLTAQIFVNCLQSGEVRIDDFNMIVMDECHHTNLEHPYNEIMKYYHREMRRTSNPRLPQMIGLTASLGVGNSEEPVRHYIKLCANLDCSSVSHVRDEDNMKELLKQNPKPKKDQITKCNPRPEEDEFANHIHKFMNVIKALIPELVETLPPPHGTQKFENWMVDWKKQAEANNNDNMIEGCMALLMLNNALQLYDQLRRKDVLKLMREFFDQYLPSEPTLVKSHIFGYFKHLLPKFEQLSECERLEDNEKLQRLHNLLKDMFDSNPESKGILLTRTLNNVRGLLAFIKDQETLKQDVKATKFVGQGRKDGTMTDVEQEHTLKLFRKDNSDPTYVNLLVATDVAQEGLDMPKCNFVIRYDFVSNEIGSVQSRGRARAKNSECYLIVNKGSVNESREIQNLEKEHLMLQALLDIDQMDQEDIEAKIKQFQDIWWKKVETKEKQKNAGSSLYDPSNVTIVCKYCKTELAKGSDMRKRGSNFICVADGIMSKVRLRPKKKPLEMRYDSQIGDNLCAKTSCEKPIGPRVMYKQGSRDYGIIFGKDHVMFQLDGREGFIPVKQWSKVPFQIDEENLWS